MRPRTRNLGVRVCLRRAGKFGDERREATGRTPTGVIICAVVSAVLVRFALCERRHIMLAMIVANNVLAVASMRARPVRMSLPKVGGGIQFGDEQFMAPKGHGTTAHPVQENLRWNVDRTTADRICSFNREAAELRGYWKTESCFLREMRRSCGVGGGGDGGRGVGGGGDGSPVSFYDSVSGDLLFVAPVGRTMAEFLAESDHHGWPSFRDAEVVWENVRVLRPSDEAVSKAGTHLGHNIPAWQVDSSGMSILENRYCINLVSIAGRAPGSEGDAEESAKAQAARAASWELRTSQRLMSALRARTKSSRPLDLLEDFYDATSGLCSEGVWHNAWLGIGSVLAARELRRRGAAGAAEAEESEELFEAAVLLADSLYDLSFDEGFRRRTPSGIWERAESATPRIGGAGERASFYDESRERRSIQNGAAVILYSLLADEAAVRVHSDAPRLAVRCDEVGDAFLRTFYDADNGRFRRSDAPPEAGYEAGYWRAADQAVGCLACLRLARLQPSWCNTDTVVASKAAASSIASLLNDFGYAQYIAGGAEAPKSHLGDHPGTRRANSWHESLACFALVSFAAGSSTESSDVVGASNVDVNALLRRVEADHRAPTGLIVHQRPMLDLEPEHQVQFTCGQAIWAAVGRAASTEAFVPEVDQDVRAAIAAHRAAWREYDAAQADEDGLLPVANVHPATRLWCNTEPAAWLLMDSNDFADYSTIPWDAWFPAERVQ